MASVQLTKMWLTNTVTTEMLGAQTAPDRVTSYSAGGEDRVYGGARVRAVRQAGVRGQWSFVLQELTQTQVNLLLTWLDNGNTILARDHRGQYMYGTFFDLTVGENMAQTPTGATYTAAIALRRVDVVEGV